MFHNVCEAIRQLFSHCTAQKQQKVAAYIVSFFGCFHLILISLQFLFFIFCFGGQWHKECICRIFFRYLLTTTDQTSLCMCLFLLAPKREIN